MRLKCWLSQPVVRGDPPVASKNIVGHRVRSADSHRIWLDIRCRLSTRERPLRVAERLVLASGIVLFFILLARLGVDNVLANLRLVGWGILLIIAAEILAFIPNTLGWRAVFPAGGRAPSFRQLLLARIAGDGANYLTPTATMGGEFVRVRMLQGQAPVASLVASVMVAKLTQTMALLVFVVCGLLIFADDLRLPDGAQSEFSRA